MAVEMLCRLIAHLGLIDYGFDHSLPLQNRYPPVPLLIRLVDYTSIANLTWQLTVCKKIGCLFLVGALL